MREHYLFACINIILISGKIKARYFYVERATGKIRDVTEELCDILGKYNNFAEKETREGRHKLVIPFEFDAGLASYPPDCGLTHYLSDRNLSEIVSHCGVYPSFPLTLCHIMAFTGSDLKTIFGVSNVFDERIRDGLLNYVGIPIQSEIINIALKKRHDDYHASLAGHSGIWGCGKTMDEAVGNLIMNHTSKFNLAIIEE